MSQSASALLNVCALALKAWCPDSVGHLCVSGHISPRKNSTRPGDGLNSFVRRRLSRHVSHDFLPPKKFVRGCTHLQLEQSRESPTVYVKPRSFVSTCRRALRERARSALFFKQIEHVFRLGLRFEIPTTRLHVEQKNMRARSRTKMNDDERASRARSYAQSARRLPDPSRCLAILCTSVSSCNGLSILTV